MATMDDLRADEVALLKGKPHPLYRGVLRLAFDNGLRDLTVKVIQFPSAENGHLAVCEATAVFMDPSGQRTFSEVGDCDNDNCGKMIAMHKVRMAATRAKGRALRDALGIGVALKEEMADEAVNVSDDGTEQPSPAVPVSNGRSPTPYADATMPHCSNAGCGKPLTKGQHDISLRSYGQPLCPACQKQFTRIS